MKNLSLHTFRKNQLPKKELTNDEIGLLFFISAILFGGFLRIQPALTLDFPISDGGLFFSIIEEIRLDLHNFPDFIEYNKISIPLSYPPLVFYLAAGIGEIFNIQTITLLIWMPAIQLILILPCVYYLAFLLTQSKLIAGITTFILTFMPRSITWLIMGGGITRGAGQLLLILSISQIYLLFRKKENKYLLSSIFFSLGVCLSHPEAALHTISYAFVLWLYYGRNQKGIQNTIVLVLSVLLLSSPWWLVVIKKHGIDPFFAASKTSLHEPLSSLFILLPISEEPFITFIIALAVWGMFLQIQKKQFLLPVMYLIPFIIEPRSAANVMIIPMSILAANCLVEIFMLMISNTQPQKHIFSTRTQKLALAYLVVSLFFSMIYFQIQLVSKRITPDAMKTFEWIKANTQSDSKFLIITGNLRLFSDYINEWFPVLTERHSQTTIQGYEWIENINFSEKVNNIVDFQSCASKENADLCIEKISVESNIAFDYMQIQKLGENTSVLVLDLLRNKNYDLVYESKEFFIFQRLR